MESFKYDNTKPKTFLGNNSELQFEQKRRLRFFEPLPNYQSNFPFRRITIT